MPSGRWTWQQRWYDLLFAHWPVKVARMRELVPTELEVDTFDSAAWIGVVPFRMQIKPRRLPGVPTASHFPELNVRTYVKLHGKPGVWFFSLDAESRLAVWGARTRFDLPYYYAKMSVANDGEQVRYTSRRASDSGVAFEATYRPVQPVELAAVGTLEHWLTERYCLFARSAQGSYRCGDIHHAPWPLQQAEAGIVTNTMLEPLGLRTPDVRPLLHFAKSIDVALWPLRKSI